MRLNKAVVAGISAFLVAISLPMVALACCSYNSEKDTYECGGGGSKEMATNDGGGCGTGRPVVEKEKDGA